MKRISALFVLALMSAVYGQTLLKAPHRFDSQQWNAGNENCVICHFKSGQYTEVRTDIFPDRGESFRVYKTATMDAFVGEPSGISKLCLSCHDGTVALESVLIQGSNEKNVRKALGDDLGNDHPISFVYDASLTIKDGQLANPITTESGLGNSIDEDLLRDHRVECISCHDVHGQADTKHLLVKNNNGSQLCLTCHNK